MSETTRRAYLDEPYRRNFTAEVVAVIAHQGAPAAVLSETWFYPEGGGQPADRGTIGRARVLDVQTEEESGRILHILDQPVPAGETQAEVEWTRRFDHMQQHTGQHLLSRCFETVMGGVTISFHLGEDEVTIDLDQPDVSPERVADAESIANRTVFANLPVRAIELEPRAAAEMGVEVPAGIGEGLIRVVLIGDMDRTACGGTHVQATGEIGPLKVRRIERTRGRTRIAFHCGQRSLADYAWRHDALRRLASELTTGEREVPDLVARMAAERRELERRLREVEGDLARERVAGELARAESVGSARLVRMVAESMDAARALALALATTPGVVVLMGVRGDRPRLLFAAAEDVAIDLAALVREIGPLIGGRGGGKPRWAEAGGSDAAKLEEALTAAARRVRATLGG